MNELAQLLFLALLGSVVGLLGGVIFLFSSKLSRFLQKHSVPFAAGVLLTVSLLVLIPESFEQIGENTFLVVLISFFVAYLFEYFVLDLHHHANDGHKRGHGKRYHFSAILIVAGDTIHNFIDGVAIAASFFVSPSMGLIMALSTLLHEIPHEIGDFAILLKAGYSRRKVFLLNLFSSLFAVLGAFFALLFIGNEEFIGTMLAISAGIFLYLGTIDFLPNIREGYKNKRVAVIPLIIGVILMIVTLMIIPHSHPENQNHGEETVEDNQNH